MPPIFGSTAPDKNGFSRRDFLKLGAVAAFAAAAPVHALAAVDANRRLTPRVLKFYNLHTRERLAVCYCREGNYLPAALKKINHILRDHRSGDIKPIDTGLLDLLHALSSQLTADSPFHIISGYRSPATNKKLRRKSRGVASRSLHMLGKAIDIRLPDIDTRRLRDAAVRLESGGVGYYARSDFVHIDVGRVRYW